MKKLLRASAVLLVLVCLLPLLPAAAEERPVKTSELIEHSSRYDGREVVFEGEAIGDILGRGRFAWLNVSDGNNSAMGIFMTAEQAALVTATGRYGRIGDRIRVKGIFHRACPEHGGDMDIHAAEVVILSAGGANLPPIPAYLIWLAGITTPVAVMLSVVAFRRLACYHHKKGAQKEA